MMSAPLAGWAASQVDAEATRTRAIGFAAQPSGGSYEDRTSRSEGAFMARDESNALDQRQGSTQASIGADCSLSVIRAGRLEA
jgi:hypothetical protein